jgi:hypothetical protein
VAPGNDLYDRMNRALPARASNRCQRIKPAQEEQMKHPSSPPLVSMTKLKAAQPDHAAFADLADSLAAAVVADRTLTAFKLGNAVSDFARWYTDAANELLIAVVAHTQPPTVVDEVLAFGLAWRQDRDLLLVLSPEHCRLVLPGRGWAGAPVKVWEYDDTLVPRRAPDPSEAEVPAAAPDEQPVGPREGYRLSHEHWDWLKMLLRADLTRQEQSTSPWNMAGGLAEAGSTRPPKIHRRSSREPEQGLAPQLIDELERITMPFSDHQPSDAELRIAQAQFEAWLEGLSHGIQTEQFARQMAAQQELHRMVDPLGVGARYRAATAGQDRGPVPSPGPLFGMPESADPAHRPADKASPVEPDPAPPES